MHVFARVYPKYFSTCCVCFCLFMYSCFQEYLSRYLCVPLSIYLFIHLPIYPFIHLFIYPFIHLSMYPSIYRSMFLCCLYILCIYLWIYVVDVFCLSPLSIWFWFVYRCAQSISFFVYLSVYLFLSIYLSLYFCLSILSVYLCLSYLVLSYFWTKNAQMHTEPLGAKGSTALAPRGISHLTPSRGLGTMAKKSHFTFLVIKKRLIWVWHLQRLVMPAFWRCQTRDGIDTGRRRFLREETHIICIIWHVWPGCWWHGFLKLSSNFPVALLVDHFCLFRAGTNNFPKKKHMPCKKYKNSLYNIKYDIESNYHFSFFYPKVCVLALQVNLVVCRPTALARLQHHGALQVVLPLLDPTAYTEGPESKCCPTKGKRQKRPFLVRSRYQNDLGTLCLRRWKYWHVCCCNRFRQDWANEKNIHKKRHPEICSRFGQQNGCVWIPKLTQMRCWGRSASDLHSGVFVVRATHC